MPWTQRFAHWFTATLVLCGLLMVYRAGMMVYLRPPGIQPVPLRPIAARRAPKKLTDLFPSEAWQNQACKRFQTPSAMLMFQNWEPHGENGWKVWPVTMVFGRGMGDDGTDHPIVVEADAGAELRFEASPDLMSGSSPPIDHARLIGDVTMRRSDGQRDFRVQTRNLRIDRRMIRTTETVDVQMGDAAIRGRDLTLHLSVQTDADRQSIVPDRLELIYLDHCHMPLAEDTPADGPSRSGGWVSLGCNGRVEYDFNTSEMSLSDQVAVRYRTGEGLQDRFDADKISAKLHSPLDRSIVRRDWNDWIANVAASGSPVTLDSQTRDSRLEADSIRWDVAGGELRAEGDRGIRFRRGGTWASLANLHYRYTPDVPKRIGLLRCDGAGMVQWNDAESPLQTLRWRGGFSMRPSADATRNTPTGSPQPRLDVHVDGGIEAVTADGGSARADSIAGYLSPDPGEDFGYRPDRFDVLGAIALDTARVKLQTERLRVFFAYTTETIDPGGPSAATDSGAKQSSVAVRQPNATAVGRLATSKHRSQPRDPAASAAAMSAPRVVGREVNAELLSDGKNFVVRQLSVDSEVDVQTDVTLAGAQHRATMTGDRLQWQTRDVEGDVLEIVGSPQRPARLELGEGYFTGPRIQVRPLANMIWMDDAGEFRLPIELLPGSMAAVDAVAPTTQTAGGMPNVFARAARLKGAAETSAASADSQMLKDLRWIEPPTCRWRGEMIFDGLAATLRGGIDIDAKLLQSEKPTAVRMTGEALKIELDQQVSLREMSSVRQAKPSTMTLTGSPQRPVMAEATAWTADGEPHSRHLFHAPTLTVRPDSSDPAGFVVSAAAGSAKNQMVLSGSGPGWYRGWLPKPASPGSEPTTAAGTTTASEGKTSAGDTSLQAVHLMFRDSMTADLGRSMLAFDGGVRIGMRSATDWNDVLDVSLDREAMLGESILDCDTLRCFVIDPVATSMASPRGNDPRPLEVRAEGNLIFQTLSGDSLLRGTAAMATYTSANDLFTARGSPRRSATVAQTRADGRPGIQGQFKVLSLHPRTVTIEHFVPQRVQMPVPTKR